MSEYTAIPTAVLEDAREQAELKNISELAWQNRENDNAALHGWLREQDAEEKRRMLRHKKLAQSVGAWICAVVTVAGLCYIDAMAAWLAWTCAVAWTGWCGYTIGVISREVRV